MSEPIKLFDRDGNPVTRYSPQVAHMEVMAGLLSYTPPEVTIRVASGNPDVAMSYVFDTPEEKAAFLRKVVDVDADMPALDGMPEPEPEPVRKVGRPRKGTGGGL